MEPKWCRSQSYNWWTLINHQHILPRLSFHAHEILVGLIGRAKKQWTSNFYGLFVEKRQNHHLLIQWIPWFRAHQHITAVSRCHFRQSHMKETDPQHPMSKTSWYLNCPKEPLKSHMSKPSFLWINLDCTSIPFVGVQSSFKVRSGL